MDIRIQHAEVTVTVRGTDYVFNQAISVTVNDPRSVTLLTSPQGNGDGISLATNLTQPIAVDSVLRDVEQDLEQLLDQVWGSLGDERVKLLVIDTSNGKTLSVKQAVITGNPSNRTMDESETSRDYPLNLACSSANFRNEFNEL